MKKISLVMPSWQSPYKDNAILGLIKNTEYPIKVIDLPTDRNYGWMGACNIGIEASKDMDYVVLSNDDILVPPVTDWCRVMVDVMEGNKEVGALSCLSWNVSGGAKLNEENQVAHQPYEVPYCAFFFFMLRREAIDSVGLLDEELVGGDDIDYCIRLREKGWKIAITPQVFIWHHYAQTGKRVMSDWDSEEHTDNINRGLIRKHGFKKFTYSRYL